MNRLIGWLSDCRALATTDDQYGVVARLHPVDGWAHPWHAVAHIALGAGAEARAQAIALHASLQAGLRYRVTASDRLVEGMTIHLQGDVRIEPAQADPSPAATLPHRGPPAPAGASIEAPARARGCGSAAISLLLLPLASIAAPALCWLGQQVWDLCR